MKISISLALLSAVQSSFIYSTVSYFFGGGSTVEPKKSSEDLISEFEFMDGDFRSRSRRLPSHLDFEEGSKPTGPIKYCQDPLSAMFIVLFPYTNSDWNDLIDHASVCTRMGITCHFPIDGRKLHQSTSKDALKRIDQMGHVIMIDPAHHNKPSQLSASAFQVAVGESARAIAAVLNKRPTMVAISEEKLSAGQLDGLLKNDYIPVVAMDSSKTILVHEVSRYPVFLLRRIQSAKEAGTVFVAADVCTGFAVYVSQ